MQTNEQDGPVVPLLVYDAENSLCHAGITNTKGYNKSLENGLLWVLDGSTGRLLPLTDMNPEFSKSLVAAGRAVSARFLSKIERRDGMVVAGLDCIFGAGSDREAANSTAGHTKVAQPAHPSDAKSPANFLFTLQDLIRQRKQDMPEGSYTTHLFKAGGSKIRKKTGEEAIELILAQDKAEITSEASDLLYHMMVLFVHEGVDIGEIFEELKKR